MHIATRDRIWILGGVIAALLITAFAWFFVISSQKDQTNSLTSQTELSQTQGLKLRSELSQLKADNVNLPKYQAALATAQLALPSDSGIPDFLRQLQSVGAATGISITNVAVATPTTLAGATSAAATADSDSSGTTTPKTSTTTPTAKAAAVYSVNITLIASGTTEQLNAFIKQLQQVQPRAVLVTSVTEAPGSTGQLALTISMQAFVAPSTATK
jgi:hypothetical protein